MSSISCYKRLSYFAKFTFVTCYLRKSYIIIFKPVLDLLNTVVVKSAMTSDNFLPCTSLFKAYSLKNILIKISPIISSF